MPFSNCTGIIPLRTIFQLIETCYCWKCTDYHYFCKMGAQNWSRKLQNFQVLAATIEIIRLLVSRSYQYYFMKNHIQIDQSVLPFWPKICNFQHLLKNLGSLVVTQIQKPVQAWQQYWHLLQKLFDIRTYSISFRLFQMV